MLLTSETKFLFLCLLLFATNINSTTADGCKTDLECNKPFDYVRCAYCLDYKCSVIDKTIFKETMPCEYYTNHCVKDYCNNTRWGPLEGYGECLCMCHNKYYGKRCENKDNVDSLFPQAITLFSPIHVKFSQQVSLIIIMGDGPSFPKLLPRASFVVYDTQGGYVARINTPENIVDNYAKRKFCLQVVETDKYLDKLICDFSDIWYRSRLIYYAKFVIPFDWTTPAGVKAVSAVRQIKLDAYWDQVKLSEHIHQYELPYPRNYSSIPIIQFTGCGSTLASIRIYEFKEQIYLTAELFYVLAFTKVPPYLFGRKGLKVSWEAYKLEGDTFKDMMSNDFYIGKQKWDIPSFHWIGFYVINMTVTGDFHSWRTGSGDEKKIESTFNICLVEVRYSPLVAVISGGSSRFVYREHGFSLDASGSKDPNSFDNSKLQFTFTCNWTQEAICEPYHTDSVSYEPKRVYPAQLESGKTYNFTLKVTVEEYQSLTPSYASQTIVVGELGQAITFLDSVSIECVYNCGVKTNPKDILYLRVVGPWSILTTLEFQWAKYELDLNGVITQKNTSVDHLKQINTPSFILIINEKSLEENLAYNFKVNIKDSPQFAVFSTVTAISVTLTCHITPESGVAGLTAFSLNCTTSNPTNVFEFYDKHEGDGPGFTGRMVTSQESGSIGELVLTRGKLEIITFDEFGTETQTTLTVTLSEGNQTIAYVREMLDNFIQVSDKLSIDESLKTASTIADLLNSSIKSNEKSKIDIFELLLKFFSRLKLTRYSHVKLGISTLHVVLMATQEFLSFEGMWHAANTAHTLTEALAINMIKGQVCTFDTLYQILSHILDCLHIVTEFKEKYSENKTLPVKNIDPMISLRVKGSSKYVIKSVQLLKSILSLRHLPAQKHKLIESRVGNLSIWIKVDIPSALSKLTQENHLANTFPVVVPTYLAKEVQKLGFYLALQVVTYRLHPVWTKITNTEKTQDVSVCFRGNDDKSCHHPNMLKYGIRVDFIISDLINKIDYTNFTLRYLDPNLNSDQLDMELAIFRLDPDPLASVDIKFEFHPDDIELYVLVTRDLRPTYSSLMKEGDKLTSHVHRIVLDPTDKRHIYYVAIHPVSVKEVRVGIKVYSKVCYTWHYLWETRGCWSKSDKNKDIMICECNRLSLIGGLVKELPFPLQVVTDFPLSLSVSDTFMTRMLGLFLFVLLFLVLFIICIKADRNDRSKRFVSILPDNMPGDAYGFLVCVVTGSRLGAGTDAAVGVKMYGTNNDGRRHILSNTAHDVMEYIGEDWFLIYEPESLGDIVCMDLWHDSTGSDANWFCGSIIIYDLYKRNCYFFIVNDWITLSSNRFPEVCLFPTPFSEITSMSSIFKDYFQSGFRLSHLWLGAVMRHPRDPVSRVDRLAIIMCFILISMATSVSLMTLSSNNLEVDDFSYSITWLMVEMSIYSCVSAALIACMLMYMFKRIYKVIFYMELEEEKITHERKVTRVSLKEDYLFKPTSTPLKGDDDIHLHYGRRHRNLQTNDDEQYKTIADIINLNLVPKPLVPVQIVGDDPNVIISLGWLSATWVTVVVIVIICVNICLYLSQDLHPVKSKKWVTIVGLSVFIHAVVLLPTKITLVSALLAFAFKRIIYKDTYTFDPEDGRQLRFIGNMKYLANFIHLRAQSIYQPLREVFREEHRREMIRAAQWGRLHELLLQIIFLIVLGFLLKSEIPIKQQTNSHLRTMIKDFNKVYNTSEYLNFLINRYDSYLFDYIWYNWKSISQGSELNYFRKDWMHDKVNRMVGKVRLRQFRVIPGYCKVPINLTTGCAAPFSTRAKDSQHYLTSWNSQLNSTKNDDLMDFGSSSDWVYIPSRDYADFSYCGKTGECYPSGGYTWDLGADSEEFDAYSARLREEGWVDHYTRAVIAQVKMYNVNIRLFSEMTLLSEHLTAGQILSTVVVSSVNIPVQLTWWLVLFLFFAVMLCVRIFKLANFVGVIGLFKNWRNPFELIMTVNALAVVLYMLLHVFIAPSYVSQYQLHSEEKSFFDFYKIAFYYFTARALLCTLYILNLIRFYSLWRFGKFVLRLFFTVIFSIRYIIWLTAVYISFQFLLFNALNYLSFIFTGGVSIPNMFYRYNYSYLSDGKEIVEFKVFYFVMCFSNVVILLLFICVFAYEYKACRSKLIDMTVKNYITFIKEEIRSAAKVQKSMRMTIIKKSKMKLTLK